ncbi:redoxin domain-containing protein [Undibacterium sp. TJN19]|uniref:redoxin domain-containing protein n=1 Tax=Undibacterium sp. TJN19 TaxID=3413055 RepID=UPI003BF00224
MKLRARLLMLAVFCNIALNAHSATTNEKPVATKNSAVESTGLLSFGHRVGERVADIAFKDIDGHTASLWQMTGTRGAIVVIRDAECPVSQRYAPRLAEFEKEYTAQGYNFIYVDVTPYSTAEARKNIATYGLQGRVVLDTDKRLVSALRAASTSEVFLIDSQGTLRYRGAIDDQYAIGVHKDTLTHPWLRKALQQLTAGQQIVTDNTPATGCLLASNDEAAGLARPVTYHNRISRLIAQKCEMCHRDGGVAPMPLQSYEQVTARKTIIEYMTSNRLMPPWGADSKVGHWANDRSLSKQELADLTGWLKAGMPAGNPAEAPLARTYMPGWDMAKPDAVLQVPEPYKVPAEGVIAYKYTYIKTNFDSDKWVTAMEIRPSAPKVVHHVLVFLEGPGVKRPAGGIDGFFAALVPGTPLMSFPEGAAKKIPKGAWLKFQIHYQPNGTEQIDQTKIGFQFAEDASNASGKLHEVKSESAFNSMFVIPPGAANHQVESSYLFRQAGSLTALIPHSHLRGKAWKMELVDLTGKRTLLLDIPKYDFNWQSAYQLKEAIHVEPGMRIAATAWYDNSSNNPANPDPKATVRFGEQTFEEMMIGYFDWIPDKV